MQGLHLLPPFGRYRLLFGCFCSGCSRLILLCCVSLDHRRLGGSPGTLLEHSSAGRGREGWLDRGWLEHHAMMVKKSIPARQSDLVPLLPPSELSCIPVLALLGRDIPIGLAQSIAARQCMHMGTWLLAVL